MFFTLNEADELYKGKTCIQPCDGDGCNDNLSIENLFSQRIDDLSCFSCQYGKFYNGVNYPNSNIYCQNGVAVEGDVPTQMCPKYADTGINSDFLENSKFFFNFLACYTTSTWRYNEDGTSYEEDFKGLG